MKDLYLLRHAKSSWDDAFLADHDRPLAPRGVKTLARLRRYVAEAEVAPALVLCSSAARARSTCEGVLPGLPPGTPVEVEDDLYAAPSHRLLDRLRRLDEDVTGVLVVGHNPGLHDLAVSLVGSGDDALRADLASAFPTGALARLSVPDRWENLAPGVAVLTAYVVPRQLS